MGSIQEGIMVMFIPFAFIRCPLFHGVTGTGLVGLSAAMLGAARVLLTDLPYTLDNLRGNVEMNHDALAGTNSLIEVTALDWFNVTDVVSAYGCSRRK